MSPIAVGIDLGTTFSALAYINEFGKPEVVKNREGKTLTPSVVAICEDPPQVGDPAKELQGLGEEGVASFFKRAMESSNWSLTWEGSDYSARDMSALVLKKLKEDAEVVLGQQIRDAVITVPANFGNDARAATKAAGEATGLNVLMTINEPTAAALAFGLGDQSLQGKLLVYDLGGGTFDVTLMELAADEMTVLATAGDHELGGKDWDDRLANFVANEFFEEHGTQPLDDKVSYNDVIVAAEQAKINLSRMTTTKMRITHDGTRAAYDISREQFESMTTDLLERTTDLTDSMLAEQGLGWPDIAGVLLVGGSTRMPMVEAFVRDRTGQEPITGVNVDEAVALGAAIQAQKMSAAEHGQMFTLQGAKEFKDVISHSLGIVALNKKRDAYVNEIIIDMLTPVPCSATKTFQVRTMPGVDVELDVYTLQGESKEPTHCNVLGKYVFSGIEHVPEFAAHIDIEYGYDSSGIVTVQARQRSNGRLLSCDVRPVPSDMSWLSLDHGQGGLEGNPYTIHAGQQRIPGAVTDEYGNPEGSQYDLVANDAFRGSLIAVLHLYTGEGFDFREPTEALQEKGFDIRRWTSAPLMDEFQDVLAKSCQVWLISDCNAHLSKNHIKAIKEFFKSGRGVYIWGDNEPYYVDANRVGQELMKTSMSGNSFGDKTLRPQSRPGSPGFASHLITTGIDYLYEGITVAEVSGDSKLEPLLYGSDGRMLAAIYDYDGRRALMDGGFTRLYHKWDTAGTGRYVKNAAGWLVNYERFGR